MVDQKSTTAETSQNPETPSEHLKSQHQNTSQAHNASQESADSQPQEQSAAHSSTSEQPTSASSANTADAAAENATNAALDAAQTEIAALKDQLQRALADNQNIRRRAQQDVEKAHKYAVEKLIKELLPVVDNLERALENSPGADDSATANAPVKAVLEGVTMTHKAFIDSLQKFQVQVVDPIGQPFDPAHHQAMSLVEAPEAEPNTVLTVAQKGYSLHGRLLRPAMVMVSKAPVKVDEKA